MSELVNACNKSTNFRWQLLATVSAIALIGAAHGIDRASAADGDADHPPVWIELGGQLSRLDESQVAFSPPVSAARPSMFSPSQKLERLPLYSIDETGKISFEPDGSNWIFSASVRYGRSTGKKDVSQRTYPESNRPHYTFLGNTAYFPNLPPQRALPRRMRRTAKAMPFWISRRARMSDSGCSAAEMDHPF